MLNILSSFQQSIIHYLFPYDKNRHLKPKIYYIYGDNGLLDLVLEEYGSPKTGDPLRERSNVQEATSCLLVLLFSTVVTNAKFTYLSTGMGVDVISLSLSQVKYL